MSNLVGRAICKTMWASSKIRRPLCASLADRLCANITWLLQAACVGRTWKKRSFYILIEYHNRSYMHTCKHHLQFRDGEIVWTALMCLRRKPQLVYALSQNGHGNGGYAVAPFTVSSENSELLAAPGQVGKTERRTLAFRSTSMFMDSCWSGIDSEFEWFGE